MLEKNLWKELCDVKESELQSVIKDQKLLLRSNLRKDAINQRKDRIIDMQMKRIEELEHLAQGVQKSSGSIVGRVTQALRPN